VIPLKDQEYLRIKFSRELTGAVRIDHFTQRRLPIIIPGREECPYCEEARILLTELSSLSDRITLNVHEFAEATQEAAQLGVDKIPGTVIRGALNRPIRYFGFPAGLQFPVIIDGIVDASRGKAALEAETARRLRRLQQDVYLQLFVTPNSPHCAEMSRLVHRLALESPRIRSDIIEATEFPRLIERYRLLAVPTLVFDDAAFFVGAMEEASLVKLIMLHVQGKAAEAMPPGPSTPLETPPPPQPQERRRESGLFLP